MTGIKDRELPNILYTNKKLDMKRATSCFTENASWRVPYIKKSEYDKAIVAFKELYEAALEEYGEYTHVIKARSVLIELGELPLPRNGISGSTLDE